MVQYGMWPCCLGARASNPHLGVCPGIISIAIACGLAVARFGMLTTPIGVTCGIIAMMSELAAFVTAAVLLGRDKPELRSPALLGWWITIIATPTLLLLSLPFVEGERVARFAEQRPDDAAVVYSCSAVANAAALISRYALIHTASTLTTSLSNSLALALSGFINIVTSSSHAAPYNWVGAALMVPAIAVHVWYMAEREKMASARLPLDAPPPRDESTGKPDVPRAEAPSERSALVDSKAPAESDAPAGGCMLA